MKKGSSILLLFFACVFFMRATAQQFIQFTYNDHAFAIHNAVIYTDSADATLVHTAATLLQNDIEAVTGNGIKQVHSLKNTTAGQLIIIGSLNGSKTIQQLVSSGKLHTDSINDKWEAYQVQVVQQPFKNITQALVITGSDRRGVAYGVAELSKAIGVSPWYWWADVPVEKHQELYFPDSSYITDAPKVKYRGIFINDEAPALSGWAKEKFGGFNHLFYAKVFELMLRLKANYLWPAMWGNAFYDDDRANIYTADSFGIVIGTSHHEPLMRAHDEWRRYGSGKWNYDSNKTVLQDFWMKGMTRAWNEKIVTVGMRGDGDEPMSRETAVALLERIVTDQRKIIETTTGKPAEATPQLWALYKEVQDYYDKGMRVPDDVTLLLCDDNWGNIRRLPALDTPLRKGGYGVYYHFDYVGDPRNYKWINTNQIPRVWEQMHLAWAYNVRQIWIVNVGDIKPMELPVSFFLDYAWNPTAIDIDSVQEYIRNWSSEQFGKKYSADIADILAMQGTYMSRRKPELLNDTTFEINFFDEFGQVTDDYNKLLAKAKALATSLDKNYADAYFQLVLHPVWASANLYNMYYYDALYKRAFAKKYLYANACADSVRKFYATDSIITSQYHSLQNGKWNHMMDQTHIGYTYWQQPDKNVMPALEYLDASTAEEELPPADTVISISTIPDSIKGNVFYERASYVSIDAIHYTRAFNNNNVYWKKLPGLGRCGSSITTFPVTTTIVSAGKGAPHLEYDFYPLAHKSCSIRAFFSPTLNFQHTIQGLQYAIAIDDEQPQVISINKNDSDVEAWKKWVGDNIIIKTSQHVLNGNTKHIIKFWALSPGIVLQKLEINFGHAPETYLGPPETRKEIF